MHRYETYSGWILHFQKSVSKDFRLQPQEGECRLNLLPSVHDTSKTDGHKSAGTNWEHHCHHRTGKIPKNFSTLVFYFHIEKWWSYQNCLKLRLSTQLQQPILMWTMSLSSPGLQNWRKGKQGHNSTRCYFVW